MDSHKPNNSNNTLLQMVLPILMAVMLGGTMLLYSHYQKEQLISNTDTVTRDVANSVSTEINTTVSYARSSIMSVALEVSQNMTSPELEKPSEKILPLVERTPFNSIEYIRADGMNVMNIDKPFDASSREYYTEGIKGKTGVWNNYAPKIAKETLMNFYTPLMYQGKPAGVITGYIRAKTQVSPLLKSSLYGESVYGLLLDSKGRIVTTSLNNEFVKNYTLDMFLEELGYKGEKKAKLKNILTKASQKAVKFEDLEGEGRVSVHAVPNTDWLVAMIVPAKTIASIVDTDMRNTYNMLLAVAFILGLYILYIIYKHRQDNKKNAEEKARLQAINNQLREQKLALEKAAAERHELKIIKSLNEELQSNQLQLEESVAEQESQLEEISGLNEKMEKQLSLIRSMNKIYFSSFYVDLRTDSFIVLNTIQTMSDNITSNSKAQSAFYNICDKLVVSDNIAETKEFVTLSTLNERMQGKDVLTFDYIGATSGWSQINLIAGDRDSDGNLLTVFVAIRKIHEEKAREEAQNKALEEAAQAAKAANVAKSKFLFNMSHDIRTPMNAIIGYTKLIKKHLSEPTKCEDYLDKIGSSSDFLLTLINNVLEMARIESGQISLDEVPCETLSVNNSIGNVYSELMKQKGISFTQKTEFNTQWIYLDTVKVNEIFLNIISNAYKYTPSGGRIDMSLKELPCEKPGYINIQTTIADTGIGMSKEFLPLIFEEFSREKTSTDNKIQGTGLGMSIIKKLVDRMGGTISVESELGKGTTFVVNLPHRIAPAPACSSSEASEAVDFTSFKGKRILLAEDNDLNAEIAMEVLGEFGFSIERAEDGIICVDMLSKASAGYYDVILMDIQMPNMDGYKATEKIRRLPDKAKAQIPILAMTANAFEEDKRDALNAGMNGHVAKPIDVSVLMKELARVLK